MPLIHYQKGKAVNIFCFLLFFLFCSNLSAQQTNNLQVIWVKTSPESVIAFGRCIASGDVNGDGYSDIMIVGDSILDLNNPDSAYRGKCWFFYGGTSFDTIPDIVLINPRRRVLSSVCSDDINGDGFDEIILGSQYNPNGEVFIFLGGNSIDTIYDYKITGPHFSSAFGCAVSTGDINSDGYKDLIVGACYTDVPPVGDMAGRVYIYFGGPNFDTIPDVILNGGHQNDPEAFGVFVSGSGDVNNDGFDDVIVGAMNFGYNRGRIYIYYGGNPMDTSYDVAMIGQEAGESIGEFGVGFLRNENTFDHAIFGSPLWGPSSPQGYNPGKIYILFGGNPMDSVPDIWMVGRTPESRLGYKAYSAGRCNNDSYDEIVAGAPIENGTGTAYLWLGGLVLDTIPDAWLRGTQSVIGIGWLVKTAGDVDGDGKDEVMISNYAGGPKRVWVCKYTGVGIEEHLTPNAKCLTLQVSPNPVKSVLRVRCPFVVKETKIYDISGKIVKEIASPLARNDNQTETKICVKELPSGIYFVEATISHEKAEGNEQIKEIRKIVVAK